MLIPSPRLAVEILKKAEKDAPGGMLNRDTKREGDKPGEYKRPVADAPDHRAVVGVQVSEVGGAEGAPPTRTYFLTTGIQSSVRSSCGLTCMGLFR
jgi:hypothetical protein